MSVFADLYRSLMNYRYRECSGFRDTEIAEVIESKRMIQHSDLYVKQCMCVVTQR